MAEWCGVVAPWLLEPEPSAGTKVTRPTDVARRSRLPPSGARSPGRLPRFSLTNCTITRAGSATSYMLSGRASANVFTAVHIDF